MLVYYEIYYQGKGIVRAGSGRPSKKGKRIVRAGYGRPSKEGKRIVRVGYGRPSSFASQNKMDF